MTIFTGIMVKSVIEHMRMRDNHVDNLSLHTYIDTYTHTYIHTYVYIHNIHTYSYIHTYIGTVIFAICYSCIQGSLRLAILNYSGTYG